MKGTFLLAPGMRVCPGCGGEKGADEFYASKKRCRDCVRARAAGALRQRVCAACGEAKLHILFPKHKKVCMRCVGEPEPGLLVFPEPDPEPPDESSSRVFPRAWMDKVLGETRRRALVLDRDRFREPGYACDLDAEHCRALWERQGGRCALTGLAMTAVPRTGADRAARLHNASIDRIDSSRNYSKDNTQLVCMGPNMMKSTFTMAELVRFAVRIALHHRGFSASSGTA